MIAFKGTLQNEQHLFRIMALHKKHEREREGINTGNDNNQQVSSERKMVGQEKWGLVWIGVLLYSDVF